MRPFLRCAWRRLFELAIISGGFSAALIVGAASGWITDRKPLFIENPSENASYVQNPMAHPGDAIIIVRSLIRTEDCAVTTSIWVRSQNTGEIIPVLNFLGLTRHSSLFVTSKMQIRLPADLAPGGYVVGQWSACQRNPLVQIGQALADLPFTVVAYPAR